MNRFLWKATMLPLILLFNPFHPLIVFLTSSGGADAEYQSHHAAQYSSGGLAIDVEKDPFYLCGPWGFWTQCNHLGKQHRSRSCSHSRGLVPDYSNKRGDMTPEEWASFDKYSKLTGPKGTKDFVYMPEIQSRPCSNDPKPEYQVAARPPLRMDVDIVNYSKNRMRENHRREPAQNGLRIQSEEFNPDLVQPDRNHRRPVMEDVKTPPTVNEPPRVPRDTDDSEKERKIRGPNHRRMERERRKLAREERAKARKSRGAARKQRKRAGVHNVNKAQKRIDREEKNRDLQEKELDRLEEEADEREKELDREDGRPVKPGGASSNGSENNEPENNKANHSKLPPIVEPTRSRGGDLPAFVPLIPREEYESNLKNSTIPTPHVHQSTPATEPVKPKPQPIVPPTQVATPTRPSNEDAAEFKPLNNRRPADAPAEEKVLVPVVNDTSTDVKNTKPPSGDENVHSQRPSSATSPAQNATASANKVSRPGVSTPILTLQDLKPEGKPDDDPKEDTKTREEDTPTVISGQKANMEYDSRRRTRHRGGDLPLDFPLISREEYRNNFNKQLKSPLPLQEVEPISTGSAASPSNQAKPLGKITLPPVSGPSTSDPNGGKNPGEIRNKAINMESLATPKEDSTKEDDIESPLVPVLPSNKGVSSDLPPPIQTTPADNHNGNSINDQGSTDTSKKGENNTPGVKKEGSSTGVTTETAGEPTPPRRGGDLPAFVPLISREEYEASLKKNAKPRQPEETVAKPTESKNVTIAKPQPVTPKTTEVEPEEGIVKENKVKPNQPGDNEVKQTATLTGVTPAEPLKQEVDNHAVPILSTEPVKPVAKVVIEENIVRPDPPAPETKEEATHVPPTINHSAEQPIPSDVSETKPQVPSDQSSAVSPPVAKPEETPTPKLVTKPFSSKIVRKKPTRWTKPKAKPRKRTPKRPAPRRTPPKKPTVTKKVNVTPVKQPESPKQVESSKQEESKKQEETPPTQVPKEASEVKPEESKEIKTEETKEIKTEETKEVKTEETKEVRPVETKDVKPVETTEIRPVQSTTSKSEVFLMPGVKPSPDENKANLKATKEGAASSGIKFGGDLPPLIPILPRAEVKVPFEGITIPPRTESEEEIHPVKPIAKGDAELSPASKPSLSAPSNDSEPINPETSTVAEPTEPEEPSDIHPPLPKPLEKEGAKTNEDTQFRSEPTGDSKEQDLRKLIEANLATGEKPELRDVVIKHGLVSDLNKKEENDETTSPDSAPSNSDNIGAPKDREHQTEPVTTSPEAKRDDKEEEPEHAREPESPTDDTDDDETSEKIKPEANPEEEAETSDEFEGDKPRPSEDSEFSDEDQEEEDKGVAKTDEDSINKGRNEEPKNVQEGSADSSPSSLPSQTRDDEIKRHTNLHSPRNDEPKIPENKSVEDSELDPESETEHKPESGRAAASHVGIQKIQKRTHLNHETKKEDAKNVEEVPEEDDEEKETKFSRGAKIAGGVIGSLLALAAGGTGFHYSQNRVPEVFQGDEIGFDCNDVIESQEVETAVHFTEEAWEDEV